jgi:hypothetical protein
MEFKIEFFKITEVFLKKGHKEALRKIREDFILLAAREFENKLKELTDVRKLGENKRKSRYAPQQRNSSQRQREVSRLRRSKKPIQIIEAELLD